MPGIVGAAAGSKLKHSDSGVIGNSLLQDRAGPQRCKMMKAGEKRSAYHVCAM